MKKLNGSGYPHSLWENQLTQEQRIAAISDIVSALCGKRSYKTSFSKEKTCEILNQNGTSRRNRLNDRCSSS